MPLCLLNEHLASGGSDLVNKSWNEVVTTSSQGHDRWSPLVHFDPRLCANAHMRMRSE